MGGMRKKVRTRCSRISKMAGSTSYLRKSHPTRKGRGKQLEIRGFNHLEEEEREGRFKLLLEQGGQRGTRCWVSIVSLFMN